VMAVRDEAVIWHDVECGSYATDLPLWRELARNRSGPVLEIGCGTGRVALDLAQAGHAVVGIDNDPALVAALRDRAAGRDLDVTALVADARSLDLDPEFALVAVPMQTLQLLGGPGERRAGLSGAAQCLIPSGLVGISIVEGVPGGGGDVAQPLPDVAEFDGWVYTSLPLDIARDGEEMVLTRLRQVVSPSGELREAIDETRLAVLDADLVEDEARAVGLRPAGRREVPTSDLHVGSTIVLLEAAR
jgi:SAM-dependent methyltransferase